MPLRDRWKYGNSVEVYRGVVPDCIFHLSFVLFSYCRSPFARFHSRFVERLLQPADSMPQRRRFRLRNRQTPILDTGSPSVASSRSGANIGNETVARRALLMTVAVCGTRLWTGSLEATCSRNSSTQLGSVPAASSHDPSRPWQAQISGVIAAHPRSHSGGFQVYVFLGSRVGDPAQAGKPATHPPSTPHRTAPHRTATTSNAVAAARSAAGRLPSTLGPQNSSRVLGERRQFPDDANYAHVLGLHSNHGNK